MRMDRVCGTMNNNPMLTSQRPCRHQGHRRQYRYYGRRGRTHPYYSFPFSCPFLKQNRKIGSKWVLKGWNRAFLKGLFYFVNCTFCPSNVILLFLIFYGLFQQGFHRFHATAFVHELILVSEMLTVTLAVAPGSYNGESKYYVVEWVFAMAWKLSEKKGDEQKQYAFFRNLFFKNYLENSYILTRKIGTLLDKTHGCNVRTHFGKNYRETLRTEELHYNTLFPQKAQK